MNGPAPAPAAPTLAAPLLANRADAVPRHPGLMSAPGSSGPLSRFPLI
jgi:hypothetical protein